MSSAEDRRLIKRYENRKLYDTATSAYVTLEDVEGWVRQGQALKIIDQQTGEDLTSRTLARIVLEQEKVDPSFPESVLRGVIQSGEAFWSRLQWPMEQVREELRRQAEGLEDRGRSLRQFVEGTQATIDEMQEQLDRLMKWPEIRREVKDLRQKVEQMEARLEALEADAGESPDQDSSG